LLFVLKLARSLHYITVFDRFLEVVMKKERKERLWIESESGIEKCLSEKFTDIEILSVEVEYDDDGHHARKNFLVSFLADKIGENIAEKFRLLCESLNNEGQNIMGELEYEFACDFDRDGQPIYTDELFQKVSEELKKRRLL